MVAVLNARVKAIMKSGTALSPKFGFQLIAKSDRAIQPTVYSNKPGCQSDFSTSPSSLVAHCCFSLTLNYLKLNYLILKS